MPLFQWNESYRTGHDQLDFEHENLVAMMDELQEDLVRHVDKVVVNDLLGKIHACVSAHFALEERIMAEEKIPGFEKHQADHARLLDQVVEIIERFENEPGFSYADALEKTMRQWFRDHFCAEGPELSA